MAALSLVVAGCGDDDGNDGGPDNQEPVAAFTFTCTDLTCQFTDGSTDPDGNDDITTWEWDFGGDGESDEQSPSHTFSAPNVYEVTLTVTDASGATSTTEPQRVTVPSTGNQAPAASFDVECAALECTFTDTSTDPDGATDITGWEWNFGDPNDPDAGSTEQSPTYTYSFTDITEVTVTLTVTDAGGATSTAEETFTVTPAADLQCEDGTPNCELPIEEDAIVTWTVTSSECELSGNTFKVTITPPTGTPVEETLFTDGCNEPVDVPHQFQNGAIIVAGTVITAQLISGGQELEIPPALRLDATINTYPTWELEFDDGARAFDPVTDPDEPDFDDLVITITADPQ
jgi:PKD repeat protein